MIRDLLQSRPEIHHNSTLSLNRPHIVNQYIHYTMMSRTPTCNHMNGAVKTSGRVAIAAPRLSSVQAISSRGMIANSTLLVKNNAQQHLSAERRGMATVVAARRDGDKFGENDGFQDRVIQVRRVTKVVKGGKQLRFRAVVGQCMISGGRLDTCMWGLEEHPCRLICPCDGRPITFSCVFRLLSETRMELSVLDAPLPRRWSWLFRRLLWMQSVIW